MKLTMPPICVVDFEWQQSWWWIFSVTFHDVLDSWIVDSDSLSVCRHDYILNDCVCFCIRSHTRYTTKFNQGFNIEAQTVYMNNDKTFAIVCNSNVFGSIIKSTPNELNIYPNDTNIDTWYVLLVFTWFGGSLVDVCDHFVGAKIKWKGAFGRNFIEQNRWNGYVLAACMYVEVK